MGMFAGAGMVLMQLKTLGADTFWKSTRAVGYVERMRTEGQ